MKKIMMLGLMVLGGSLSLAPSSEAPHTTVQTLCPVMEGNAIDPSIFADYRGERIYFCCNMCRTTFKEDPAAHLAELPQFADTADTPHEDMGHDHAIDHDTPEDQSRLLGFIGKFHPVAVHLPIALILVAAFAEGLAMITKKDVFFSVSRFNIDVAVVGAAVSIGLGLSAALSAGYSGEFLRPFITHKWLGIATGFVTIGAAALAELAYRQPNCGYRWSYRRMLIVCVALVGATGYFGGQLVYGLDHYAW